MQSLEPIYTELCDFNLIEASAGTGKTYTITALYVRLVLELEIPVSRILVVTYTKAATRELRDRIRKRLSQLHNIFLRGQADKEDELGTRLLDLTKDRETAIRRLNNAIRGFDEAAIYTIHGFCKRALDDNSFRSGLSFETEMMADTSDLLREIAEDFWRKEFYEGSPAIVKYFFKNYSPDKLLAEIRNYLGKPYLTIMMPEDETDGEKLRKEFDDSSQQVKELWSAHCADIEDLLLNSKALKGNIYRKNSVPIWLEVMNEYLQVETPSLELFYGFDKFTTSKLGNSVKKNQEVPKHSFFDACDRLKDSSDALIRYCQHQVPIKLLNYCKDELKTRKWRQQVQSYDDLLMNLHDALHHPKQGQVLAKTLHERYQAALIDEFQDTDPIQYEIFRKIYAGTGQPVFLVGDPKQAIYSFRGADIFAYLNACRDTAPERRHTLDVNWRSDPRLLTALNVVFGTVKDQPFLFDDIPFHHARPAEKKKHESLTIQGCLEPPLQLWWLESEDSTQINKGIANEWIAQATATEIARLLNLGARNQAHIGERPLAGGDIAVLVRSHQQAGMIRHHLLRLGVPSVQHSDGSVFSSGEAQQLEWLLAAVIEQGNEWQVRATLASALLGLSGEELYRLQEDEQAWTAWLEKFRDYRHLWQEQGFIRFFRAWLVNEKVAQRLLAFHDGERRLTNLLHLVELLHVASRSHLGMAGLLKWLHEHRGDPSGKDEEQQLRLETDENLVKIVTIHSSKGLEYEVVFCPFAWDGKLHVSNKDSTLLYHDPDDLKRTILAIGAGENTAAHQHTRREEMAEKLRLFYVALTRAKQRCYLAWGKINESGTAPPAWLLHQPSVKEHSKDLLQATQERFGALDSAVIHKELQTAFADADAGDVVAITLPPRASGERYQPPAVQEPELQARTFSGSLFLSWRIGSFTSLMTGHAAAVEMPDYDMVKVTPAAEAAEATEAVEEIAVTVPERTIFDFPRGARVGTCLHAIFERLDFARHDREILERLVERTLTRHGLDAEEWTQVVVDKVEQVLATPLNEQGLTLATVKRNQRLDELEFTYPLANLRADTLRKLLEKHGYTTGLYQEMIESLEFSPIRGYMKGFIDLIFEYDGRFYLVDYKSNWLGAESTAYRRERLDATMVNEAYYLQYLIYTVALHRYLQLRLPDYDCEKHFGGVFYLFLRGMEPASGSKYGVFYDRPAPTLVNALDQLMATGKVAA